MPSDSIQTMYFQSFHLCVAILILSVLGYYTRTDRILFVWLILFMITLTECENADKMLNWPKLSYYKLTNCVNDLLTPLYDEQLL
jgi:dolichol kinase